jgi:four helix bundle protein
MDKKYLNYNDLTSYKKSHELSNKVWELVINWNYFAKDTIGKQFVRSVDSISSNIAEGFGRFHKKDKIHFYRYASGSLLESRSWLDKSYQRELISEQDYLEIKSELDTLPKVLNILIKYTNEKLKI